MNGSDLLAFRAQAQLELEALFPAEIIIPSLGAGPVPCAGGSIRELGSVLGSGGFVSDYELSFRVRRALLPSAPEVGKLLTFEARSWRLMRVSDPQNDVVFVLGCDNPAM